MDESSVEMAVLAIKDTAARCRPLTGGEAVTLRADRIWDMVPGEIVTVSPRKQWSYGGHPYMSGEVKAVRLDVAALGLVPLRLEGLGVDADDDDPRHRFEMEQVIPGENPEEFSDPISDAADLIDAGDYGAARKILMDTCQADLRCLDAHAHLGNLAFSHSPKMAIRHYEVGVRIGELSLGVGFDGLLPWIILDNRPFLRCLHGFGLSIWRLGRMEEALAVFERMLRLNPMDNQGARFVAEDVRDNKTWEECQQAKVGAE